MPNHCENHLHLNGPTEQLDKFVQAVRKEDGTIDIAGLLPMPEALKGTTSPAIYSPEPHENWAVMLAKGEMTQERYDELVTEQKTRYEASLKAKEETGYTDWYDWCLKNWGTKWGDYDHFIDVRFEENHEFGYHTAWGPFCDNFWIEVSRQFPELTFVVVYEEEGMGFAGADKYQNGDVIASNYVNDIYATLGELNWEDDDARDEWMDKKTDLLDSLLDEVSVS